MPKANNMYGVAYKPIHKSRNQHKHGNDPVPKSPIRSGLVNFLAFSETCKPKLVIISQIFVCLLVLMVSANVWAAPSVKLSVVDVNGNDSVFGPNQKLRITIGVTGLAQDPDGPYSYTLKVNDNSIIGEGPHKINKNQTKTHEWDGAGFSDGTYTIRFEVTEVDDGGQLRIFETPLSREASATFDKTKPEISIGTDIVEFSPNRDRVLDTIDVFYSISEDVEESLLEFLVKTGENNKTPFGQSIISLDESDGSHTFDWSGRGRGFSVFPDGQYVLKLRVVDKGGNSAEAESSPVTIDTETPIISHVVANEDLTLVDGVFINTPIQSIKVTADAGGGTPLNFTSDQTEITVQNQHRVVINGDFSFDAAALTLSLGNRLDAASENGKYTVSIAVADRAGNAAEKTLNFTFDNVEPNLREVATSNGKFTPGSGVSTWTNFVEATLSDNLQDGLSLSDSTIRLTGPNGAVLGRQTQPAADKIRWILLSPLLATDGLMDGVYTIEVLAVDQAGNETGTLQIPFIFDNLAPLVTLGSEEESPFTLNQDTIYHAQPLSQIVATFDDAGGVGVNLQENTDIVFDTLPGRKLLAKERNQLTYVLETPLTSRDGSQDGRYVLNVQATDTLGNTKTYNYHLIYDTQLPTLVSTVPAANETISELSQVEVVLDEATSGMDFIQSVFRLTHDTDETTVDVPVNLTSNGTDTATLILAQPIALDGSDDGTYTIEVTPTDLAGNLGVTVRREFYLVSQSRPEIRLTMPETTTINSWTTVVAELTGYIGTGINFDASTLTVRNSQGVLVQQAKVEHDEANNMLTWSTEATIPGDGSTDGEYTVTATFVDFSGQRFTQEFSFVLDTQFPAIESVYVESQKLTADTVTTFDDGFSSITVNFNEAANDIHFGGMVVTLKNQDGAEIALNRSDDGRNVLTLSFATLDEPGEYSFEIVPQDLFGNQSTRPFIYPFRLDFEFPVPQVNSVLIDGSSDPLVYVNGASTNIVATFLDVTDVELDLSDDGSTITVTNESGLPAPGITTSNGTNQLTWIPIVLPTDGSADGRYTVTVTPKDKAGRQGDVVYRQFIYDTESPRITASSPLMLSQLVSYISGLNQFAFTVEDVGPAGLLLEAQKIELIDSSGSAVPATLTYDELTNQLYLTLSSPFARDGSADGAYTVRISLVDKAGNRLDSEHALIYDSQVPQPSSVMVNTESPVELVPQLITYISETVSSITLQFEEATRVDFANTVVALTGPGEQGIPINVSVSESLMQLTVRFVELTQDGSYTVSVTPQDIAGNVVRGAMRYSFLLDTESPRITASSPLILSQPVSYVGGGLNQFVFTVEDVGPADLLLASQAIELVDGSGSAVPATLTSDELTSQLYLTLPSSFPRDGSVDGAYTIRLSLVDRAGNTLDSEHAFIYDSQVPRLASVSVNTASSMELVPQEITEISESISSITLQFDEATRVDFANTVINLVGPDGQSISLNVSADGLTQLTARFVELTQAGLYTLSVTPQDIAGNVAQGAVQYSFRLVLVLPSVSTVELGGQTGNVVFLNGSDSTIVATLVDGTGTGLALGDGGSSIVVTNPSGAVVPGQTRTDGANQLIWQPISLPTDGSADGRYTVAVTPIDKAGRQGDVVYRQFIYDTESPRITASSPLILSQPVSYVGGGLNQFVFTVEDVGPADLLLASQAIELVDGSGSAVPATLTSDELTSQLYLTLPSSFPRDGSVDGAYTIRLSLVDRAGNTLDSEHAFIYDSQVPRLSSVMVNTESPMELVPQEIAEISESVSTITLEFEEATRVDFANTVVVLTGPGGQAIPLNVSVSDSFTQFTVRFVELTQDGSYTLSVTPQDIAGNTAQGVVQYSFLLDTESPRITASSPLMLSQPVSYVGGGLNQFVFTVEDVGPADLLLASQSIELIDATGGVVPAMLTSDELTNQLYLTLSSPFARDGSADGTYTVRISLVDKAGNRLDSEHAFIYDSQVPRLSSVTVNTEPPVELVPREVAEILEPISSIGLQFDETTRVDFANTVITLVASDVSGESAGESIPLTLEDDGTSQVTVSFMELNQIGTYILSVTPQDIAGNVATGVSNYTFILDIPLPRVSSVIIGDFETAAGGDIAYVNASNMIIGAVLLDPTETGLAFGSEGSDITVVDSSNTIVLSETGSNGVDLLVWEPLSLTTDGTTDGRYSVYVFPVDKAGRQGNTVYREFIYDTQAPEITAAEPIDLSQPVSYISEGLTQFHFTVADVGPADLMLSDQKVSLRDASGNLVLARLTNNAQFTNNNEYQLFLTLDRPLPLDGSMDGEYTVVIELADKAGNSYTVEHLIVYDTQAPSVVSTVPADGALLTEDVTQIQVTLNDEGGSGIDWATTTVTLVNPSGLQISGELTSNGTTALTLSTNQLVEDGRYIIRVRAVDRAGNGGEISFERSFLLSRRLPTIVSTEPITAPEDEAFTSEEVERIEVMLETDDNNHLSTLRLLNPENQVVAGQQQRATGRLIYNLIRPLATDGSADGLYTIEFTPISASGRSGGIQRLIFMYDTQAPEIENDDVISLVVAQPAVNNSLTEIRVNLTDNASGIDWENLEDEWLTFERLSPNPTDISGRVSDDGQGNLTFRLTVPLADNGSADGEYRITVSPRDRAGNGDEPYEKVFVYDTSPPMIETSTLLINDAPLLVDINADDYPTAVSSTGGVVIQANIFDTGLGVNLAQSKIVVRRPDGSEVSGNTQQNGVDTIVFKSDGLSLQGSYQVTVTSVGNDSELLGFAPTDSITAEFLYETGVPTATVTSDGGATELTDEPLLLEGTATDPGGTQRIGEGEIPVPPSGVWLVEIVGTGPDNQPIDPVPAVDDSSAQEEPWSRWSIDFLPTRSGEYDLDVRVTDNAGNYAIYDIGEYTMSVSLTFRGSTFGWPNPLRLSKRDVAFFSFDVNVPLGETIELTLSIYDWSGDMVLSQTYSDVVSGQRNDQLVKWNLENQAGNLVARGLYIFRLEAVNAAGNSANAVGKVLVVD